MNSIWIAEIERTNRVHPNHTPERYAYDRHFILGFHDSTFECVAEGYRVWKVKARLIDVLRTLANGLFDDDPLPFELVGESPPRRPAGPYR